MRPVVCLRDDAAPGGRRDAGRRDGLSVVARPGRRAARPLLAAAARLGRCAARSPPAAWLPPAATRAERSRLASASTSASFGRPGHRHRRRLGCRSGLVSASVFLVALILRRACKSTSSRGREPTSPRYPSHGSCQCGRLLSAQAHGRWRSRSGFPPRNARTRSLGLSSVCGPRQMVQMLRTLRWAVGP